MRREGGCWKNDPRDSTMTCSVTDKSWFRRTTVKQCLISEPVGCLGAGCNLCLEENRGKSVSRER
jgi:hypothetical protein